MRVAQPRTHARLVALRLCTIAAGACVAVSACGGGAPGGSLAGSSAASAPAQPTLVPARSAADTPAGTSAAAYHLTGNLCADATAVSRSVQAAILSAAANHNRAQRLLLTLTTVYAELGSEAPGNLRGTFDTLASFYRSAAKAAGVGRISLADMNAAFHPATAAAERRILNYAVTHCGLATPAS
jgi:hypothetical protein